MTMTEKILARASERGTVAPGENVWVKADMLMTHDVCGPGTIGIFHKEFGRDAKVSRAWVLTRFLPMPILAAWADRRQAVPLMAGLGPRAHRPHPGSLHLHRGRARQPQRGHPPRLCAGAEHQILLRHHGPK